MLIDCHVHTCEPRVAGVTRPNGSHYPSPARLLERLDESGIDRAVVMTSVSPECRYTLVSTEEVLTLCQRFGGRLVPCCGFDPRFLTNSPRADFGPLLEGYKAQGCRGVGEYTVNLPFDDPLNMHLFAQVEESGLPLTFHIAPRVGGVYGCVDEVGLPRLERVLQAFPQLLLLGHSQPFWAEISAEVSEENRNTYPSGPVTPGRVVDLLRTYPNLYGDLSANSGLNALTRDPEFGAAFLEEFQDRLLFGTDIANDPQALPTVDYFRQLRKERLVSEAALEKIAWRNAARVFRLDLSAEAGESGAEANLPPPKGASTQ